MTAKSSLGRTIKALREKIPVLCADDSSRTSGVLLDKFLVAVNHAQSLRKGTIIPTMSDKDLQEKLDALKPYMTGLWPAVESQHFLDRAQRRLIAERKVEEWYAMVTPWGPGFGEAFDPYNPLLRQLPRVPEWRAYAFRSIFFDQVLCQMVLKGHDDSDSTLNFVTVTLEAAEAEDVLEMDAPTASMLDETCQCLRALQIVLTTPFSNENFDDVREVLKWCDGKEGSSKGPHLPLALAMKASGWYKDRAETMLALEEVYAEKGPMMEEMQRFLQD